MKIQIFTILGIAALVFTQKNTVLAQTNSSFEDLNLAPNSFWDGSATPNGTTFTSGNAIFPNNYSGFGYWASGWAYSNTKDSTTAGFGSLFNAVTASGFDGSSTYAIGQQGSVINLNPTAIGKGINGFYVTNTTYAALSMRDGDSFAKKFGGTTGNDPDFFKLLIRKWQNGAIAADSVEVFLADFRAANNTQDYILKNWQWVDLSPLGNVDSLSFELKSSDVGNFGINTPTFFCIDNFITTDAFVTTNNQDSTADNVVIFPNPTSNIATIRLLDANDDTAKINVTDIMGKTIDTIFVANQKEMSIDVSNYANGVYFINIIKNDTVITKKLLKQ